MKTEQDKAMELLFQYAERPDTVLGKTYTLVFELAKKIDDLNEQLAEYSEFVCTWRSIPDQHDPRDNWGDTSCGESENRPFVGKYCSHCGKKTLIID